MAKPSLLILSTYPIVKPRHGGQIRTRAIADAYVAAGFSVTTVAVVEKGAWPAEALGSNDIEFPPDDPRWFIGGENVPLCNDLRSGVFAAESPDAYARILKRIPSRLAAIHLEQPWLLPLAKRLMAEPNHAGAVLVYGSQNIEAPLRETIFRQLSVKNGEEVISRMLAVETAACREADLTLAVAPFDHEMLEKMGARHVIRAPNGIDAWHATEKHLAKWRGRLKELRRFALFVGSAHPPNFDGFFKAFGDALGFIPPDCRIVVAGSVGPHINDYYHRTRFNTLSLSRLEITGEVEAEDLAALKTLTSLFLLPIFEGGGSNIKTAEAIYSGKRVIATSTSLRGFDAYLNLPEVAVADTREQFRERVRRALSPSTETVTSVSNPELRAGLLWNHCLASVAPAVQKLLR